MKVLKGLALGLLTLMLFLSFTVFSFAFLLRCTALNPRFVASELDRLDLAALLQQAGGTQALKGVPKELRASLAASIQKLGPQIETRLRSATGSVYDYLLGRKESPGLAETIGATFVNAQFVGTVIEAFDPAATLGSALKAQLRPRIPADAAWARAYIDTRLDPLLRKLAPQIKEQMKNAAGPVADYLLGKRKRFSVAIRTGPLLAVFREDIREYAREGSVPQLQGLSGSQIDAAVDEVFSRLGSALPASYTLDQTTLGSAVPAQISAGIRQAEKGLEQARHFVRYFQIGFWILIAFLVLLIAAVALLNRRLVPAARYLGILFLAFGAVELAIFLAGKGMLFSQLERIPGTIAPLGVWLPGLVGGLAAPLLALAVACGVAGSALLAVSIVFARRTKTQSRPAASLPPTQALTPPTQAS